MRSLNPWPLFPAPLPPQAAASLSLQFLVQELLFAFRWLDEIEVQEELDGISSQLEKFLLFSLEHPLSQKGGFLDKLCFYLNILLQHSAAGDDEKILEHVQSMKDRAVRLKSHISLSRRGNLKDAHFFSNKPQSPYAAQISEGSYDTIYRTWKELIQTTQTHLKELFDFLFPFFQEFRQDENLLFLLIEQKEPLNQYLGHQAVEAVLAHLFPQGACSLREALYNGYARRGFLDFYSRNEELIESVDWEDACSLSNPKSEN